MLWHDEIELSGHVPVYSDPQKLRQILFNLLGNAVKYTEQGDVSLRVKKIENDYFSFSVSDTGPGIESRDCENILEAFHQETARTQKGGTGLGLAITQKQLELLNSELKITSTVGKGSDFSFTLKLKPALIANRNYMYIKHGRKLLSPWTLERFGLKKPFFIVRTTRQYLLHHSCDPLFRPKAPMALMSLYM